MGEWGGARPGAGRKKQPPANDNATKAAPDAKVVSSAPPPAERPRPMFSDRSIVAIIEAVREMKAVRGNRQRTPETNPYIIRPDLFGPVARHIKGEGRKLAMDDNSSLVQANQFAVNAWQVGAYGDESEMFLGYPRLAQMNQRPEFRLFGEIMSEEMTRKWVEWRGTDDESTKEKDKPKDRNKDDEEADQRREANGDAPRSDGRNKEIERKIVELKQFADEIKLRHHFKTVAQHDSDYGVAHLYLDLKGANIDDLRDPENAQSIGNGRNATSRAKLAKGCLLGMRTIEPVWCYPTAYNAMNPLARDWYDPVVWYVMGAEIHRTRLLPFVGRPVSDLLKPAYAFGGLSMTQMAQPYVDIWLRTRESVGEIIHAFSTMILSTNMATTLQPGGSGGGNGDVVARMMLANMLRDNQGMMVIDKSTEDFKNVSAPLGGLDELQAQSQEHMFSVGRIPAVKFAGIQPKGLNATSEGELRAFGDTVHGRQEFLWRNHLTSVIDIMQVSLWGERDPDITIDFAQLQEETPKEKGEIRKLEAETDQIRIDSGVVSQEEVRAKLVGDEESGFHGLDPDDVPDLLEEEEGGLIPEGAGKGLEAELANGGAGGGGPAPGRRKPGAGPSGEDEASDVDLSLFDDDGEADEDVDPPFGAIDAAPGIAAGIVHQSPDRKVLLLRRSETEPNYGGHWSLPGGKADAGETPEQAARRENGEEMGPRPVGKLHQIHEAVTPTGMRFHTFLHKTKRFNPHLNDEHDGFIWADRDGLPEPLHPGVKMVLGKVLARDDWNEGDHPRAPDGKFGAGSGGKSSSVERPSEDLKSAASRAKVPQALAAVEETKKRFGENQKKLRAIVNHIDALHDRRDKITEMDRPEAVSDLRDAAGEEEEQGDLDIILEYARGAGRAKAKDDEIGPSLDPDEAREMSESEKQEFSMIGERLKALYPLARERSRELTKAAVGYRKSLNAANSKIENLAEALDDTPRKDWEPWMIAAESLSTHDDVEMIGAITDFLSGNPLSETAAGQIDEMVEEFRMQEEFDALSPEEQERVLAEEKRAEAERDAEHTKEVNSKVDAAIKGGWWPQIQNGEVVLNRNLPPELQEYASPSSLGKIRDRFAQHLMGEVDKSSKEEG